MAGGFGPELVELQEPVRRSAKRVSQTTNILKLDVDPPRSTPPRLLRASPPFRASRYSDHDSSLRSVASLSQNNRYRPARRHPRVNFSSLGTAHC